jgi:hypothetical protein
MMLLSSILEIKYPFVIILSLNRIIYYITAEKNNQVNYITAEKNNQVNIKNT